MSERLVWVELLYGTEVCNEVEKRLHDQQLDESGDGFLDLVRQCQRDLNPHEQNAIETMALSPTSSTMVADSL